MDRKLLLLSMGIAIPFVCAPAPEAPGARCPYGAIHLDEAVAGEFFAALASQSNIWWRAAADEAYWQLSVSAGEGGIPHAIMAMRAHAAPPGAAVALRTEWEYRYLRLQSFAPSIYPEMARKANEKLLPEVGPLCREWQIARNAERAHLEAVRRGLVAEIERARRASADRQGKQLDLDVQFGGDSRP